MSFQELIEHLLQAHGWKAGVSIIVGFFFANIMPVAPFLVVGVVLVASDWVTGVTAAISKDEKITSHGLRKTVIKIIFYCLAIVLTMMVEVTFFHTKMLVFLVASYIATTELYSNLENISTITGIDIIGTVKTAIKSRFNIANKKKEE